MGRLGSIDRLVFSAPPNVTKQTKATKILPTSKEIREWGNKLLQERFYNYGKNKFFLFFQITIKCVLKTSRSLSSLTVRGFDSAGSHKENVNIFLLEYLKDKMQNFFHQTSNPGGAGEGWKDFLPNGISLCSSKCINAILSGGWVGQANIHTDRRPLRTHSACHISTH